MTIQSYLYHDKSTEWSKFFQGKSPFSPLSFGQISRIITNVCIYIYMNMDTYIYKYMYIYVYIYIYNIYIYIMLITHPEHSECSNLTETRWD